MSCLDVGSRNLESYLRLTLLRRKDMEPSIAGSGVSSPLAKKPNTLADAAAAVAVATGRDCLHYHVDGLGSALKTMTEGGRTNGGRIERGQHKYLVVIPATDAGGRRLGRGGRRGGHEAALAALQVRHGWFVW